MNAARERFGRYAVAGELGRGAMGVVYRGRDELLGRAVAIKTIHMTFAAEDHEGYLARFRQEARALGALNHPAIISVYDYGDDADIAYMAMELLEGRELRDLMDESPPSPAMAVDIAAQVAEGLAFAHARGVVHRDVKPGNVMVVEGGRVKIMDFGIARVRASDVRTQTGMMLGSPKYMSPEQVLGHPADHRSDIFSLGVVLHEMLAGAPPFSGDDIPQLMYQVCNARPPAPSRVNPAVPEVLDLIVAKALEKEPEARYQDAAQFAADLRAWAATASHEAREAATPLVVHTSVQDSTIATRTMQSTMAIQSGAMGLLPWRRFDSASAIERLARPQGDDRLMLAPAGPGEAGWSGMLRDRVLLTGAATIAVALALALTLAFG